MDILKEKVCTKCKEIKQLSQFHKSNKTSDGVKSSCKQCHKEKYKDYKSPSHVKASIDYHERREKELQEKVQRTEKLCIKCNELLPLSSYRSDPRQIDGREGICGNCERKKEEQLRRQKGINPPNYIDYDLLPRLEKELGITDRLDPSKYFLSRLCPLSHDWNNTGFTLKVKYTKHYQECCECKKQRSLYDSDKQRYRAWLRNPRISLTVAELVFKQESSFCNCNRHLFDEEYKKKYDRRNREDYSKRYKENPEKEKLRMKIYKASNPEKVAKWGDQRRRRLALQSDGTITKEVIERLLNESKKCLYCSSDITPFTATIDHIIPIALGGQHSEYNLVVCCQPCNNKKHAKPFHEWINELDDKHKDKAEKLYRQRYGASPYQQTIALVY
jgi:5-methylcytosine-specific restriction endonuclease McrA